MTVYKCFAGDQKKENVDYILSTEDNREVIIFLTVLWNQDYNQRFGWKNLFSSPSGFTYIVFNMERHLARPAFLAVFINQDNQYQQNKLEKNIMIKHKWDVKACFERYNTNEKHKAIILFYFFPVQFICSWGLVLNLFHCQDTQVYKDRLILWLWTLQVTDISILSFTFFEVYKNKIVLLRARAS